MSSSRVRAAGRLTAVGAMVLATLSCTSSPPPVAAPPSFNAPPSAAAPPPPPQADIPSCDPRASLRPLAAVPPPGQPPAGSTMARIVERGRLIAGVDQQAYLFGSRDTVTGSLEGFDIDIVRDIALALFGDRDRVELRQVDVADRVRVVESGSVDLVVSTMTITCRRLQTMEFSAVYLEAGQRVLVNRGMPADGLDDLGGKRVCAARGSTSLNTIAAAPSRPVPVGVTNVTDCLVLLQLGEIDAVSTDDTLLASLAVQDPRTVVVGPRFTEEPYGVAVNRANTDLVRFVNAVLERRAADGTWQASYQRWLGSALGPPSTPPAARYRD